MPATGTTAGITAGQEPAKRDRGLRWPAEIIAATSVSLISGAAGLAHQVLWTRRLVDVLGATSLTFSKVVGAFFLGLALGGWIASRWRIHRNPWFAVVTAELLTAVFALPVLWLPQGLQFLPPSVVAAVRLRLLLPLIFIVPPALCMGLVLPSLVRVLDPRLASRQAVLIYSLNILGGICGIVLLLLYTLPSLGTARSGLLAVSLNLAIAGVALVAAKKRIGRAVATFAVDPEIPGSGRVPFKAVALAFISGMLILGSEVVLQHQFAQITINSFFSNVSVLALVLLGLGLSALLLPIYERSIPERMQLPMALTAAAVVFAAQPSIMG